MATTKDVLQETLPAANGEEDGETRTGREMDPEIRTIGRILRILDDLDEGAKGRVVTYIAARYAKE